MFVAIRILFSSDEINSQTTIAGAEDYPATHPAPQKAQAPVR